MQFAVFTAFDSRLNAAIIKLEGAMSSGAFNTSQVVESTEPFLDRKVPYYILDLRSLNVLDASLVEVCDRFATSVQMPAEGLVVLVGANNQALQVMAAVLNDEPRNHFPLVLNITEAYKMIRQHRAAVMNQVVIPKRYWVRDEKQNVTVSNERDMWERIGMVRLDLHHKYQAARHGKVQEGFETARRDKLIRSVRVPGAGIEVVVEDCQAQILYTGHVEDTPENFQGLVELGRQEAGVAEALRKAGYDV